MIVGHAGLALGSMHGQGCRALGVNAVNGEPLRLRWSKGCLWIDLDERVVDSQKSREESQLVTAGGSRMIPESHILLRRDNFPLQNVNSGRIL